MRTSLRLWFLFDLPDKRPEPITEFNAADRVIVLAPHMDDEAIGCGGAILRHAQAGSDVTVVYMTDGSRGGYNADNQLVERRKNESRKAAEVLGIKHLLFLDAPDLALTDSPEIVRRVVETLNDNRPTIIYAPALTDRHPDHWATNSVLHAALAQMPADWARDVLIRGYEVWSPLPANRLLDISAQFELKRQAVSLFESQLSFDYVTAISGLNQYRSLTWQKGKGYAEAYLESTVSEYRRMFTALLTREATRTDRVSSE
jgi:LmbE family N-acetylglucosaminyl deacetylase